MSEIFFTGCTHFDHAGIIRMVRRPFASLEDMNEAMIARWNAKVGPNDTVYHLGDFGFLKNQRRHDEVLGRLNGEIHLIHGNHDHTLTRKQKRWVSSEKYLEIETPAGRFVLFHYPIEEWNGCFRGARHLHAHTHRPEKVGAVPLRNRINVTVEAWDYAPAHVDEIAAVWPR